MKTIIFNGSTESEPINIDRCDVLDMFEGTRLFETRHNVNAGVLEDIKNKKVLFLHANEWISLVVKEVVLVPGKIDHGNYTISFLCESAQEAAHINSQLTAAMVNSHSFNMGEIYINLTSNTVTFAHTDRAEDVFFILEEVKNK